MGDERDAETYLHRDEQSFKKPLADAFAACRTAFLDASRKVAGAEARVRAALNDLETLKAFARAVEDHIRARSFQSLPGATSGRQRLDRCHQLAVGPWRGVFLVNDDGAHVVALLFSKSPHALDDRLGELVAAYDKWRPEDTGRTG